MSKALTECVSAPMEMISTPVSATGRSVSSVIPPEASIRAFPFAIATGFAHRFKAHIVEHNDLRARVQGLGHLIKIAGFHFNFYHMAKLSTQKSDRVGDATGGINVVILEHRAVGEVVTVVFTAAARRLHIFAGERRPGSVLRVTVIEACVPSTSRTACAVAVAMPDICWMRLSAVRLALEQHGGAAAELCDDIALLERIAICMEALSTGKLDQAVRTRAMQPTGRRARRPLWQEIELFPSDPVGSDSPPRCQYN